MTIRTLETSAELQQYDAWIVSHKEGSLWQSLEWKTYQESLGRKVRIYACISDNSAIEASALVVIDTTMGGLSTWDIPRGPLISEERKVESEKHSEEFMRTIIDAAKKEKCLALYASPSTFFTVHSSLFTPSARHVQPEATRVVDLTKSEEDILGQMHSKGRYNITLAKKHGIEVMEGTSSDIPAFYELLASTGGRDGFKISQKSHYERFLSGLEGSFLMLAKHENRPIAGLMGAEWNGTTIYYYGASSYAHRSLMAPYLLQWEAMRRAKARGCTRYDVLGISPENAGPHDPWQGISDFKRKFGGEVVTYPAEQMLILRPILRQALEMKRKLLG